MTAPETLPPELAELGELLREDPPRPDPTWARRLDSRAAAGFPRPPRRSPWAVLKAYRRALIPAVSFACVALLVVGISSVNLGSDDVGSGGGSAGGGESSGGGGTPASGSVEDTDSSGFSTAARPRSAPAMGGGSPGSDGRRTRAQERSAALTLAAGPRRIEEVAAGILRVTDA